MTRKPLCDQSYSGSGVTIAECEVAADVQR